MKVSKPLAHQIDREVATAIGLIEVGESQAAIKVLMKLAKLVNGQAVEIADNCENCGYKRTVLEMRKKKSA